MCFITSLRLHRFHSEADGSLTPGYTEGFNTAFRGGSVMGYALCSLGVLVLWVLLSYYRKVGMILGRDGARRSSTR